VPLQVAGVAAALGGDAARAEALAPGAGVAADAEEAGAGASPVLEEWEHPWAARPRTHAKETRRDVERVTSSCP
jgi:hypothetical protein